MKTNVIVKSSDRELFGTTIRQETKTGFLNLSDLQNAFESVRYEKKWTSKHIPELLTRKENLERIYYILEKQNFINVDLSTFIENAENKGITSYLKTIGVYKTTGARHTKTTWCNPYIWVLLAMELSPEIYAHTIMWLTDELIINRIGAGNFYKELSGSLQRFNPNGNDFMQIAKGLNYIVFNKHEAGIRNQGTKSQLKELEDIEKKLAFAINMGYINSINQLLETMRKMYHEKHGKYLN